jgi:hypothetical protein
MNVSRLPFHSGWAGFETLEIRLGVKRGLATGSNVECMPDLPRTLLLKLSTVSASTSKTRAVAADTQSFRQTGQDAHNQLDCCLFAVEEGAVRL